MGDISTWFNTAAANDTGSTPDYPVEGWAPSTVNAWGREVMAAVRRWFDDAEWTDRGHTIGFVSATQFTTASGDGDTTAIYHVGVRVKTEVLSGASTIYGRVTASSHSTQTTVTVTWDSGALDATITQVWVATASADNPSIDVLAVKRAAQDVITTQGDVIRGDSGGNAERLALGSANEVLSSDGTDALYQALNAIMPTGSILQTLTGAIAAANGTTSIPRDNTTPLVSEGTEIWTQAITPAATANDILVRFNAVIDISSTDVVVFALFRGSTCIGAAEHRVDVATAGQMVSMEVIDSPSTTSPTTYSARIGAPTQTWYIASLSSGAIYNGELAKNIYAVQELKG